MTDDHKHASRLAFLKKLTPLIGVALFLLAIAVLHHEIKVYHWHKIKSALAEIPFPVLLITIVVSVAGYLVLTLYDWLALEYVGQRLPYRKVVLASFLSYALSNNVGHAMITGGTVRLRLYSEWGVSPGSVAKIILFCAASYVVGAISLMLGGYLLSPDKGLFAQAVPHGLVIPVMLFAAANWIAWYSWILFIKRPITIKGFRLAPPVPGLALRQLIVAMGDTLIASVVLYIPLTHGFEHLPLLNFVVFYVLAQMAGLISQVPGGIGVFESSFLFLCDGIIPADHVLASLIVFRSVYFLLPLLLAGIVLLCYELKADRFFKSRHVGGALTLIEAMVPAIFSALIMVGGGISIFAAVVPDHDRLQTLHTIVPLSVILASRQICVTAGAALIILSTGVLARFRAAYFLTLFVLGATVLAVLARGLEYEEAIILGVVFLLFLPTRRCFPRRFLIGGI